MIDTAVAAITDRLNQYLRNEFDLSEDVVVVSNLLEQNGTVVSHIENKVVVFLVNIEKETAAQRHDARSLGDARHPARYPPLYLNLYLMFAACFGGKNYPEALKFISNTIAFFQRNPLFDHQNTPELDARVDRLIVDMENIPLKDLNSLWSVLSGKYLPSALYKVRLLTFTGQDIKAAVPAVRDTEQTVQGS
ncbi:DUF4255 domain-containing protein [Candidatus Electronema sp. PJ]|uniref:DUF4255 domain-containing protein n=1 Tax=Candidatus Electronema sp. PJ TaxID=3401572 RepID=UPI003AA7C61E